MFLYLVRHGEASQPGPDKPPSLTPRGKTQVLKMADHLRKNQIQIGRIWHSPKTRAVETADIFVKVLADPGIEREEKDGLSPDGDALEVHREIIGLKETSLLVVSHLPLLPNLAALFLKDCAGAPSGTAFPTASMMAFKISRTCEWLWFLDPQSLL